MLYLFRVTCNNVIKFLVIFFDEKVYDAKVYSIALSYLKFHDFRVSFCRYRLAFLHKVNHIFSYIRLYFVKSDENYWREDQGSE